MHHIIGTAAGVLAVPAWTTALVAVIANHARHEPVFRIDLIILLVAAGVMLAVAWFTHITVTLASRERQALYLQGVRDALSVDEPGGSTPGVTSIASRTAQRLG